MELINALVDQLMTRVGDIWLLALSGSFFAMVCEAAKPKPGEGESRAAPTGLALFVSIFSLLTPLLLFFHAVLTGSGALIAVIAAIGTVILGSALIGWAIAAFAPSVGRTLNLAAPMLALASFALTIWVTWRSIFEFINSIIAAGAN